MTTEDLDDRGHERHRIGSASSRQVQGASATCNSSDLDEQVRATGNQPFVELEQMARERIEKGELPDYPVAYLAAFMGNHGVMTLRFLPMSEEMQVE